MRKIYLSAIALSVGSLSFGQQLIKKEFSDTKMARTVAVGQQSTNVTPNFKAPGDVLWSENFDASSSLPTGWSESDNTGNAAPWIVQATGVLPDADFTTGQPTINSTSGVNCMLYYSDFYQSPPPPGGYYDVDAYFQTAGITLNNVGGVSVNFQQSFRNCCSTNNGVAVLIASTDPTFPAGPNTESYDIIGGVATNAASADPMDMSVNISSIAANYTGDIYLRFHIQSGIEAYFWMIDDIEVVESPVNDITTASGSAHFFGVEYTRIPVDHIQPMDVSMRYNNIGSADQPNSNLTVTVNDGTTDVFVGSSANITIPSLSSDTIEIEDVWTPPTTVGVPYTVTLDILSDDSTDFSPSNNSITFSPFEISQNIMALDDYSTSPGSVDGPNGATEYEIGNQFDAIADDVLHGIDFVTGSGTAVGTLIDFVVYRKSFSTTAVSYTELYRSGDADYTITAADIGATSTHILSTPLNLDADSTYFVAIHTYNGFEYGISGTGPLPGTPTATHSQMTSPTFANPAPNSTFGASNTPMIRLNFDNTLVGINQVNATTKFKVFPNPSNGLFTINLDADNAKTVNLTVKNIVGQTIINKMVNVAGKTTETISLSDYSKGVYFLTVDQETVKLIVE